MTIKNPSLFFRALVLGAQGVFYNLFCEHNTSCLQIHALNHDFPPSAPYSLQLPLVTEGMPSLRRLPRRRSRHNLVRHIPPSPSSHSCPSQHAVYQRNRGRPAPRVVRPLSLSSPSISISLSFSFSFSYSFSFSFSLLPFFRSLLTYLFSLFFVKTILPFCLVIQVLLRLQRVA